MFFEPAPTDGRRIPRSVPELPPWSAPPALEAGAVLAAERTVARGANVAVLLPTIRAFSTGCMLDIEVVTRQGSLSDDDFWDLHMSMHMHLSRSDGSARLPDRLLRLGVRYADGAKATTIEQPSRRASTPDDPPAGPLLSWTPGGSGSRSGHELHYSRFGLWLWPLPPAEPFEFAVEWPFGGIEETIIELDGAAIAAAAERSARYWPDPDS
jgi:hypothetical protein